ncbi:hypothetical protein ScPMuIL_009486 [Solemya velum]
MGLKEQLGITLLGVVLFADALSSAKLCNTMMKGGSPQLLSDAVPCDITTTFGQVPTQQEVDYISENLDIKYEVLYNRIINGTTWRYILSVQRELAETGQAVPTSLDILPPFFLARITFTNKGPKTIPAKNWDLYICHSLIEPAFYDYNTSSYVGGAILFPTLNATFVHIQGCMFKMTPYSGFQPIAPGQSMSFNITSQPWSVARSDVMPNWYVGGSNRQTKVVKSTAGNSLSFVEPFDNPEKWKRAIPEDLVFDPFPPQFRYQLNTINDGTPTNKLVIPTPNGNMLNGQANVKVDKTWAVFTNNADLKPAAQYLKEKLGVKVVNRNPAGGKAIILRKQALPQTTSPEAYRLQVQPNARKVTITSPDPKGIFNGIQTLRSLVDNDKPIPGGTLNDLPRFHYRGVHIDVARNFMPANQIIKMIDAMAMYKLNKLHLHLSDDEGWRLDIPGIPELVEIGSKRCHDPTQTKCIWPQLGSGPDTSTSGSGHFSVADYKRILTHANKNQIEVIPELEMPGRSRPAVAAMEARFLKYYSTNVTLATQYRLFDQNDTTNYLSRSTLTKNGAMNPCMQSTYDFVKKIMTEVIKMHKDIQPLRVFHFGGDEAPPGSWVNSTACSDHQSHNVDLKRFFTFQVAQLARTLGVVLGAWEDGVAGPTGFPYNLTQLGAVTQVNAWNNIGEYGFARRAYDLANLGYQVVLSSATHLFIDHPQEPDPEEPGYYWATRFTNTSRVFKYLPGNITLNNDYGIFGQPLPGCGMPGLPPCPELTKPQNIIGMYNLNHNSMCTHVQNSQSPRTS